MEKKNSGFVNFLETVTIIVILLVFVQTFLEDLTVFIGAQELSRTVKLSAIFFDLYFTIEFFVRLISAVANKRGKRYLFLENGWVDFLASIPLLLFVSMPYAFNMSGAAILGGLGFFKLIKAIRVTRILRLLRVLKIFGKIKNVESKMAQRHITAISTIIIFALILFVFSSALVKQLFGLPSNQTYAVERELDTTRILKELYLNNGQTIFSQEVKRIGEVNEEILLVRLYDNVKDEASGRTLYDSGDYTESELPKMDKSESEEIEGYTLEEQGLKIYFSRQGMLAADAFDNLLNFILIFFILFCIVVIYLKHFAQTITDPIYVMRNGFEKRDYTLAVKIPENYADDDIFRLANDYNSRWLPAKLRKLNEMKSKSSMLSLDDVFGYKGDDDD